MVDQDIRYWYKEGLRFECTRCGRCCSGPTEGFVWVDSTQIVAIAMFLGLTPEQFTSRFVRQQGRFLTIIEDPLTKDCIFLRRAGTSSSCAIYPVRPIQCRTWPFWASNLESPAAWLDAGRRCPGIDNGRLYTYEQICQISESAAGRM